MAGFAAYQGAKGLREGIMEGDTAKAVQGAGTAYGAGKQGLAAKAAEEAAKAAPGEGIDYTSLFEGKTDEEIEALLELEEQNRLLKV